MALNHAHCEQRWAFILWQKHKKQSKHVFFQVAQDK